jgi:hypothetical protein
MAVEVEAGAYIYDPSCEVFSHNPLHDLESLWWVGVWFLLCHYRPSKLGDDTVQKHIKTIKKFGQTLFNNRSDQLSRRHALIGSTLLASTKPKSFPHAVQYLVVVLNKFRAQLVKYYESYKPNPKEPRDQSFFTPDVHRKFGDIFEDGMKALTNDRTELWSLDHIEAHITYLNAKK